MTRWYAPSLGRFISEDSLLGDPARPPSRHLYAYGEGEPIGRWDPDGRFWYKVKAGDTLSGIASRYLGATKWWAWIFNRNRHRIANPNSISVGWCIWIPNAQEFAVRDQCSSSRRVTAITATNAIRAASALGIDLRTLTYSSLLAKTVALTGRGPFPIPQYNVNRDSINGLLAPIVTMYDSTAIGVRAGVTYVDTTFSLLPPQGARAMTVGGFVFVNDEDLYRHDPTTAHEYIHVLYEESFGLLTGVMYGISLTFYSGLDPAHPFEALAYLWDGYIEAYGNKALGSAYYGDNQPWCYFRPAVPDAEYCG